MGKFSETYCETAHFDYEFSWSLVIISVIFISTLTFQWAHKV